MPISLVLKANLKAILSSSGGRSEVTRGKKGELKLDVRAMAPLYTGLFTPHQLQLTGQIEASETALSIATQLFTGLQPWMCDEF